MVKATISRGAPTSSVSGLLFASVLQKAITFTLNTILLRHVSSDVLGLVNNDMELMVTTVLFLSREGCRISSLRSNEETFQNKESFQKLVNLAWFPVPVGVFMCLGSVLSYFALFSKSLVLDAKNLCFLLFVVGTLFETLSEPAYILLTAKLGPVIRARTEVIATLLRGIVIYCMVRTISWTPVAFALGHLSYSLILLLYYWRTLYLRASTLRVDRSAKVSLQTLLPEMPSPKLMFFQPMEVINRHVGAEYSSLLVNLSGQTVIKHFLQESDRIMLTALVDIRSRGEYSVIQNYGSLIVRLVFFPLEESLRANASKIFSKHIVVRENSDGHPVRAKQSVSAGGEKLSVDTRYSADKDSINGLGNEATSVIAMYREMITFLLFFSVPLSIVGYTFSPSLVHVLLPNWRHSNLSMLLSLYCLYLPTLACNGLTEALSTAISTSEALSQYNKFLSVSFVVSVAIFLLTLPKFGIQALIIQSIVGMIARFLVSLRQIRKALGCMNVPSDIPLIDVKPTLRAIVALLPIVWIIHSKQEAITGLFLGKFGLPNSELPSFILSLFLSGASFLCLCLYDWQVVRAFRKRITHKLD